MSNRQEQAKRALKHMVYNPKAKLDTSQVSDQRDRTRGRNPSHTFYNRFDDSIRKKERSPIQNKYVKNDPKTDGFFRAYGNQDGKAKWAYRMIQNWRANKR